MKRKINKIYFYVIQSPQKFIELVKKIMMSEKTKDFRQNLLRILLKSLGLAVVSFIGLLIFDIIFTQKDSYVNQSSLTKYLLGLLFSKHFLVLAFLSFFLVLMIEVPTNVLKVTKDRIMEFIALILSILFLLMWLMVWMVVGLNPDIYFGMFFIVSISLIILLLSYVKLALEYSSFIGSILAILFYYVSVICVTGLYFGIYYAFTFYHFNINPSCLGKHNQ